MKLFKQFKNMVDSSVENIFAMDNKEEREVTLPEKPKGKPVREESKQITILKRFNNEIALLRKLTEGSIKYNKENKTYTDYKGKKIVPGAFSAKFVEMDEKKKSLFSKIEAPNLSTIGTGLGIAAMIVMFGPQLWPFVKGFLKEVVSGFIEEGIKTLPEPMQKFIGWFTSSGDKNPATVFKNVQDQFVQGNEDLGSVAKDGDEIKSGSEKFTNEAKQKIDEINKTFKDADQEKTDSGEVDAIKDHSNKLEKRNLEDPPEQYTQQKKDQPEQEKKPTVAVEQKQEEPKNKATEPKIQEKKEATTPPPPTPKIEQEVATKSINKPVTQHETKQPEPQQKEAPKKKEYSRNIKTEPEAKPAAAVTAPIVKPSSSPAPTVATPTKAPTPSGSFAPTPVEKEQESKKPIVDRSVEGTKDDSGTPTISAQNKITSIFNIGPYTDPRTGEQIPSPNGKSGRPDPLGTGKVVAHAGIDLAGKQGAPLGILGTSFKVTSVRVDPPGYGNYIDGMFLKTKMYGRFAHLSRVDVRKGDVVEPGGLIGLIGSTGHSSAPHLHYEYRFEPNFTSDPKFVADPQRMPESISFVGIGKTVMDKSTSVAEQKNEPKQRTDVIAVNTSKTVVPISK